MSVIASGHIKNEDQKATFEVLLEAFAIYQEREERYKGLWKEGGTPDSLHHMKSKHARTQTSGATDTPEQQLERIDDPLDLINYTVFYIRNLREGRLGPRLDTDNDVKPEGWPDQCASCGADWRLLTFDPADGFCCTSCGRSDADE